MIHKQWYIIAESRQIKNGKPIGMKRLGEKLVLWRDADGKVSCMQDQCIHRGAARL